MLIDKGVYKDFQKAAHLNGGAALLRKDKPEVAFDPSNSEHMLAVKVMFLDHSSEALLKRRQIGFKFRLESPYTDILAMVQAKIMVWAISQHEEKRV